MKNSVKIVTPDRTEDDSASDELSIERLRIIIQESHLNFLIGAGASVPFINALGDIENTLSNLKTLGLTANTNKDEILLARASVQGYFFKNVILPNLKLLEPVRNQDAKKLIQSYGRFLAAINLLLLKRRNTLLGKQVNLFTTNVDLALETALELLEIDTNDGFIGKFRPRLDLGSYGTLRVRQGQRFEYHSEIPTFNFYPIHGSVGWVKQDEDIYFDHSLSVLREVDQAYRTAESNLLSVREEKDLDATALISDAAGKPLSEPCKTFLRSYNTLQIVNPEKTKFASTVLNKTYYELIRRFANELEKENSVLFVHGFSFRDEHLLDLTLRAAATNPTLQVIVFCFSREQKNIISALFPRERIKNSNILFVQPKKPDEGGTERNIDNDVLTSDFFERVLRESASNSSDHIIELRLRTDESKQKDA